MRVVQRLSTNKLRVVPFCIASIELACRNTPKLVLHCMIPLYNKRPPLQQVGGRFIAAKCCTAEVVDASDEWLHGGATSSVKSPHVLERS